MSDRFGSTAPRVVYTAIFGGVDQLVAPERVGDGWDYLCFSDEPVSCPPWRWIATQPHDLTPARASRRLKVNATTVLPTAKVSLWVDGNVQPLADPGDLVERYLGDADIACHLHPERDCLFDEAVAIIDQGKDTALVLAQVLRYARLGMPTSAGLHATGGILRRHTPSVAAMEATWWAEILRGSHRDQLSLPYALRDHGLRCALLEGHVWNGPLFRHRRHDGARAPVKVKLPGGRAHYVPREG